ncbi:hypothetical protein C8034_v002105 [Colletotrichum sidae]|uniref:Uncharacterized protein n=1 Tax=Colletotrichum sidae TaxID=1347389 RepID=A0A4R8SQK3_9PEZI|nr:hypothetical protein C8034_v002105 [Colletotrichum sidae]
MNIDFIKVINKNKNYNYFYKSLKKQVLYKSDFTILLSFFQVLITIFSLSILLEDKAISKTKNTK